VNDWNSNQRRTQPRRNPPLPPRTEETWENPPSATTLPLDLQSADGLTEGVEFVSVDRPLFLSLINLVQLMEPRLYLAINPLLMIGTLNPNISDVNEDVVDPVNDMIESIWGKRTLLVVPIVLESGQGLVAVKRGMEHPVKGLRVATKTVTASIGNRTEQAIIQVKAEFKHQDVIDCIESGRSIIKLTLLGKLVTMPEKPTLSQNDQQTNPHQSPPDLRPRGRSRHHSDVQHAKRHRSSTRTAREHSPVASIYSAHETNRKTKIGRLFDALRL
jgi:hypothetical protein